MKYLYAVWDDSIKDGPFPVGIYTDKKLALDALHFECEGELSVYADI